MTSFFHSNWGFDRNNQLLIWNLWLWSLCWRSKGFWHSWSSNITEKKTWALWNQQKFLKTENCFLKTESKFLINGFNSNLADVKCRYLKAIDWEFFCFLSILMIYIWQLYSEVQCFKDDTNLKDFNSHINSINKHVNCNL